ncbi:hypothetical protein BJV74DRAFT_884482 [Russula compacta]|nr:hypothetical protein BJV74DRAFT_884482 [Russula compacta]
MADTQCGSWICPRSQTFLAEPFYSSSTTLPLNTAASLLEIDSHISLFQNRLLTFPRSHPLHFACLYSLAILRLTRYASSAEVEDLDKSISHSTEAILLPFDSSIDLGSYVIGTFFYLVNGLLLRSQRLEQPSDVNHGIKYLRYLQEQSLETFAAPQNEFKALLMWALAVQVELESVDPMSDIGEMATLCRELLTSGDSESLLINSVKLLVDAIIGSAMSLWQSPCEAIECLRGARIRLPDLQNVRTALAISLLFRFNRAHSNDDYEEAKSILDEMIADPKENVTLAMQLVVWLAQERFRFDSKPEHLAEAIPRVRTLLKATSFEDPVRPPVVKLLADLEQTRFEEFGVRSGRQEDNAELVDDPLLAASPQMAKSNRVEFPFPMPDKRDPVPHLRALVSIDDITDLTNLGKAIEYCRLCLASPHPHVPLTLNALGNLLNRSFHLTGNIDHLNESITVYRYLIKMPDVPINLHTIARQLIDCLVCRLNLFKDRKDADEIMKLFPSLPPI